jgi:hypothetical protein
MAQIDVVAAPLPFSNLRTHHALPYGHTITDIIQTLTHGHTHLDAIVTVGGCDIPRECWQYTRPKEGTLVNIRIVPQGGGGGGKNPLATILSLAVLIAAPYAGAFAGLGALNAGIGLTAGQGILLGNVAAGAFALVGTMLVNAIAPPPRPSNAGFIDSPAESPTQFIDGARNDLSPFGVVPICLGTNRMFPLQAARPFTESQNNNQYSRQLFTYGYGAQLEISDLRIGDTAITEFDGVELNHRLNGDLHLGTALYSNDIFQDDFSVLLRQVDGFTLRTTQADADEIIVDVTFPAGLVLIGSDTGAKNATTVELELQFAPAGTSNWSPGAVTYTSYGAATLTLPSTGGGTYYNTTRTIRYLVKINKYTGAVAYDNVDATLNDNEIRIASFNLVSVYNQTGSLISRTITGLVDERQPSLIGTTFQSAGNFLVTHSGGLTLDIAAGGLRVNDLRITAAQTEALRKSVNIKTPTRGRYDVRIKRLTADSSSQYIQDEAYLTALRTVTYIQPVNLQGINGTALRILGTDQLNGLVDSFNAIVSNVIPDYNAANNVWTPAVTSNPASIYRYVLQGGANARPLTDSQIDLAALQSWHTYCAERGYTYNRVIDYDASVDGILRDVAAAGAASPTIIDGKRSVVVDKEKDAIVQMVTPRNSWDYGAEIVYTDLPHAFRVTFRNAAKGYVTDERIVYDDGYSESNATKFEQLEYLSCTNSDLAFKHARRHIASARLRPEIHTFTMDVEHLVATRGDRIKLAHDVPITGVGDGRIKTLTDNGINLTGFSVDDGGDFIAGKTYYARIRKSDGSQLYLALNNPGTGRFSAFTLVTPLVLASAPAIGDLCYFVEAGGELDLIITKIEPQNDLSAKITAVDYAPAVFTAESATIPTFESKITTPIEFIRPSPPTLVGEPQSDESVMTINSDGTFTSRMVITLENSNTGGVVPVVQVRQSGTDIFSPASLQEATPTRVVITGLQDGFRYDVHIRYRREGGTVFSLPLQLNNTLYIGASGVPADVQGFSAAVAGATLTLSWDANDDIDISHYSLRFSAATSGVTWDTAQVLAPVVNETQRTLPFVAGTYLIRAVDLLGNLSANAAAVVASGTATANVVALLDEAPSFTGAKTNVINVSGGIQLADVGLQGTYNFANSIDLGAVFTSQLSASVIAQGAFSNNIFAMADIFAEADIFGGGNNDIFAMDDIFAVDDIFGIGTGAWSTTLQIRTTNDDPTGSPVWSAWRDFVVGEATFRAAQFRLLMTSLANKVTPLVTGLSVTIDMPDRIERGESLTVPVSGTTITYAPAFKATPSVVITLQDAAVDDRIEFISNTASGFTFKVFNATAAGYVERMFNFISSGYGRQI